MKRIRVLAILMVFCIGLSATAEVTFESLLESSDIVLDERAAVGARVAIVERPEEAEGGKFLKTLGLSIGAIAKAWRMNPRNGLESLLRNLAERPTGTAGTDLILNPEFTSDLSGWTAVNAYGGASDFGPEISAPAGSIDGRFAVAHTGQWDNATQGSLEQTFTVPTSKDMVFTVAYNFISTDWPSSVGRQWNDNAIVTVSDATGAEVKFALFESVSSSTFTTVENLPDVVNGGIFDGANQRGGQTGWLTKSSETIYFGAGTYKVRIEVNDAADAILDSAILVDMVGLK